MCGWCTSPRVGQHRHVMVIHGPDLVPDGREVQERLPVKTPAVPSGHTTAAEVIAPDALRVRTPTISTSGVRASSLKVWHRLSHLPFSLGLLHHHPRHPDVHPADRHPRRLRQHHRPARDSPELGETNVRFS